MAERRAKETMKNINLNWPRDARGWFAHWTNRQFTPEGEYSTIDSAIMIAGAYFAGNYFGGELATLAEEIGNTPDWPTIYVSATDSGIYMVSNAEGMSAQTQSFNEYYLLCYLAMAHEDGGTLAKDHFRDVFGLAGTGSPDGKPAGRSAWWGGFFPKFPVYTSGGNSYQTMSDSTDFMTSFTVQFAWMAVKGMSDNPWYKDTIYPEWAQADRLWWNDQTQLDWAGFESSWGANPHGKAFGCGAGDTPAGYGVIKMGGPSDNKQYVFSAANMAGFLGVNNLKEIVSQDLQWLYINNISYTKDSFR